MTKTGACSGSVAKQVRGTILLHGTSKDSQRRNTYLIAHVLEGYLVNFARLLTLIVQTSAAYFDWLSTEMDFEQCRTGRPASLPSDPLAKLHQTGIETKYTAQPPRNRRQRAIIMHRICGIKSSLTYGLMHTGLTGPMRGSGSRPVATVWRSSY